MTMSLSRDMQAWLEQNALAAATLSSEQLQAVEPFAEHHAGGLFVLGCHMADGRYVKAHDTWGDEGTVVVNVYDPDEPDEKWERDIVAHCATGREAVDLFLTLIGEGATGG